jgi:hypothetical protein
VSRRPKHGRGLDRQSTRDWQLQVDVRWFVKDVPDARSLNSSDIHSLLKWLSDHDEADSFRFFRKLAELSPHHRLVRNLTELSRLLLHTTVKSVLVEGLNEQEHAALRQMEMSSAPLDLLGIAHSLLNIEERGDYVVTFGTLLRDLRTKRDGYIEPAVLSKLLESNDNECR